MSDLPSHAPTPPPSSQCLIGRCLATRGAPRTRTRSLWRARHDHAHHPVTGACGLDLGVLAALRGSHNTSHTARIAWVADPDPHVRTILAARLPGVPNLGDITTVDWRQVEPVDVLTAGFPCQDISAAGKRAGIEKGTRSGPTSWPPFSSYRSEFIR